MDIDREKLRELYDAHDVVAWILDHAAGRKNNQAETKVSRILVILRREGHDASRPAVIQAFRCLEELGCGQFVTGRHGWESRFVWAVEMISLGLVLRPGNNMI
jgi:hypothetical protein